MLPFFLWINRVSAKQKGSKQPYSKSWRQLYTQYLPIAKYVIILMIESTKPTGAYFIKGSICFAGRKSGAACNACRNSADAFSFPDDAFPFSAAAR